MNKSYQFVDRRTVSSVQIDPALAGTGSSPMSGDLGNTGLVVPEYPTPNQNERYLFNLCGIVVPQKTIAVIRNIYQLLYIGADVPSEPEQEDEQWLLELPVTDPMWSFPNGNVSWHLTSATASVPSNQIYPDVFPGGSAQYATRGDALSPALLALRPATAVGTYRPLNGGVPYGSDFGGIGTFRDIRFPWAGNNNYLGIVIKGPNLVRFFASVYQTDPDTRPNKPVALEEAGLRAEDLFMLNYPNARYTRVGGRLDVDFIAADEIEDYPISS